MTQRTLDVGMDGLKHQLMVMSGYVEVALESAIQAWRARSLDRLKQVYQIEDRVNDCHKAIDDACLKLLATQQPMASDLRLILSIVKINSDLERMVDQAVNIANNAEYYLKAPPIIQLAELSNMADEVKWMVKASINAVTKSDETLAHEVCLRDDKVDEFKDRIFRNILAQIKQDPSIVEQGFNLILIARNLERIGDHATNIAEDVIFTVSGEDIRHGVRSEPTK